MFNNLAIYNDGTNGQCGSHTQNHWYLIRTKPGQEDRAFINLGHIAEEYGALDLLFPRFMVRNRLKSLFPGYLFGSFKEHLFRTVDSAFGVAKIIRFGMIPAEVPVEVIGELRRRMMPSGEIRLHNNEPSPSPANRFANGDKVAVIAGPLKGFYGVFDRELSSADRVRILLDTVGFSRGFEQRQYGCAMHLDVSKHDLMAL